MPTWLLWTLAGLASIGVGGVLARRYLARAGRRTVLRFRARVDRYKLTRRRYILETLLADPHIARAVEEHAAAHGTSQEDAWRRVRIYLAEIVPYFNVLAYYRLGYSFSKVILNLFYRVTLSYEREDPFRGLPRDAVVIYLMNHRSNADYVLVAYALAGDVSISYAVGEWARAFPLEYIFKSFGSYFIRRRYREPLYHKVLERYIGLITRNAVTQGIFPEGGLTRDGTLRPGKIGLLDYALAEARDPDIRSRMFLVPVGINYDRVLEDRSLLRELESREKGTRPSRFTQLSEVSRFAAWNAVRLLTRRWKRYGRAAVTIGVPRPVSRWLDQFEQSHADFFALKREERLPLVQQICDDMMASIGQIVPVTPVALACAALQTFESEFVGRSALVDRMREMALTLRELNATVLRADHDMGETLDRALIMLRLRRVVADASDGDSLVVLAKGRPLVSYYANSIVHLLGPYAEGVRRRDALPLLQELSKAEALGVENHSKSA